jgi:hypothetical protein
LNGINCTNQGYLLKFSFLFRDGKDFKNQTGWNSLTTENGSGTVIERSFLVVLNKTLKNKLFSVE